MATAPVIAPVAVAATLRIARVAIEDLPAEAVFGFADAFAVDAGFTNAGHMQTDADLSPLRERDDFKKLVAELEAKQG